MSEVARLHHNAIYYVSTIKGNGKAKVIKIRDAISIERHRDAFLIHYIPVERNGARTTIRRARQSSLSPFNHWKFIAPIGAHV